MWLFGDMNLPNCRFLSGFQVPVSQPAAYANADKVWSTLSIPSLSRPMALRNGVNSLLLNQFDSSRLKPNLFPQVQVLRCYAGVKRL
jgi:hypothetical protein